MKKKAISCYLFYVFLLAAPFANGDPPVVQTAMPNSTSIIIDGLVTSDIDGSIDGVYDDANRALVVALSRYACGIITKKGYVITNVHVNSGLVIGQDEDLVYAKDDKSTGVKFIMPALVRNAPPWTSHETRLFLGNIFYQADRSSKLQDVNLDDIPDALREQSRFIVLVAGFSRNVPFSKSIAVGALTGLLTGGLFLYMPTNGAGAQVAVVDMQDKKIIFSEKKILNGGGGRGLFELARKLMEKIPNAGIFSAATTIKDAPASDKTMEERSIKLESGAGSPIPENVAALKVKLEANEISEDKYREYFGRLKQLYLDRLADISAQKSRGDISDVAYKILGEVAKADFESGPGALPKEMALQSGNNDATSPGTNIPPPSTPSPDLEKNFLIIAKHRDGFFTIHYRRKINFYDQWVIDGGGSLLDDPVRSIAATKLDDFGAVYYLPSSRDASEHKDAHFIIYNKGDGEKDLCGQEMDWDVQKGSDIYIVEGDCTIHYDLASAMGSQKHS